jgi:hypothetical protein
MTSCQNLTQRETKARRDQPGPVMWTVYLVGHLALEVHGQFDHVVVGGAREKDLAGVEFVQRAAH